MTYRIIRSNRKTVSLQITPEGELLVRCPQRMRAKDIDAFVRQHEAWIRNHMPDQSALEPKLTDLQIQTLIRQAKERIPVRVRFYATAMAVDYGNITVRSQRTRWGSCSAKGNLNFNCLLMLVPEDVLDYVVVHELCHRKQLNHSAAFWTEVEQILPDYRERRKWLKEHGTALIARLP